MLDALTPKVALNVEGEDARIDSRSASGSVYLGRFRSLTTSYRMIKDERVKGQEQRSIFNVKDTADRLG